MKKLLSIILILSVAFFSVACGNSAYSNTSEETALAPVTNTETALGDIKDYSFDKDAINSDIVSIFNEKAQKNNVSIKLEECTEESYEPYVNGVKYGRLSYGHYDNDTGEVNFDGDDNYMCYRINVRYDEAANICFKLISSAMLCAMDDSLSFDDAHDLVENYMDKAIDDTNDSKDVGNYSFTREGYNFQITAEPGTDSNYLSFKVGTPNLTSMQNK